MWNTYVGRPDPPPFLLGSYYIQLFFASTAPTPGGTRSRSPPHRHTMDPPPPHLVPDTIARAVSFVSVVAGPLRPLVIAFFDRHRQSFFSCFFVAVRHQTTTARPSWTIRRRSARGDGATMCCSRGPSIVTLRRSNKPSPSAPGRNVGRGRACARPCGGCRPRRREFGVEPPPSSSADGTFAPGGPWDDAAVPNVSDCNPAAAGERPAHVPVLRCLLDRRAPRESFGPVRGPSGGASIPPLRPHRRQAPWVLARSRDR